jgi:hypothetical protein
MQNGRITGEIAGDATEEAILNLAMADHLSAAPTENATPTQKDS